jgi:hypothetical protein
MCFEDRVKCKKDEQQCLGSCSGDTTSVINYDFSTMIAVGELNEDVLGEDGYIASAANCWRCRCLREATVSRCTPRVCGFDVRFAAKFERIPYARPI